MKPLSTVALVLGVVLMMFGLYGNAVVRAARTDPSAWPYAMLGFGLLLVLSAIIDVLERPRTN